MMLILPIQTKPIFSSW